jgi:hypothetical protein
MNTYPYTEAVLHRAVLAVACMNYSAQKWAEERSAERGEVCVLALRSDDVEGLSIEGRSDVEGARIS